MQKYCLHLHTRIYADNIWIIKAIHCQNIANKLEKNKNLFIQDYYDLMRSRLNTNCSTEVRGGIVDPLLISGNCLLELEALNFSALSSDILVFDGFISVKKKTNPNF